MVSRRVAQPFGDPTFEIKIEYGTVAKIVMAGKNGDVPRVIVAWDSDAIEDSSFTLQSFKK